jgi:hypothetical protein
MLWNGTSIFHERRRGAAQAQSEPAARGWSSVTIGEFLESMRAWAVDSSISDEPSWRLFAEMIHNGKL